MSWLLPEAEVGESRYIATDGGIMHYMVSQHPERGSLPVVLVHGVGLSHRYLMPLFQKLAQHFTVYVPDQPGFGRSYSPAETLTLEELADCLDEWMEAMELSEALWLGNSVGCQVIIRLAVRHPQRVRRAVLQGPTTEPGARTFLQQARRWRRNNQLEQSRRKSLVTYRSYWDSSLGRALKTFRYALDDRPEEHLPTMTCPTLVVRGSKDPIVSQAWAERVTELLPNGQLKLLPGLSHTINWMGPLELSRVVRPFFEEALAGST